MGQNTTTRRLPLLNNLKIATPCSESWDGMVGDDQVRFCGGCLKNVYNISAMTTREAQELIADKEGDVCIRMFQRRDGTLINADCPVGIRRQRATKVAAAAMVFGSAGVALAAAAPPADAPCDNPRFAQHNRQHSRAEKQPQPDTPNWLETMFDDDDHVELMGDVEYVPPVDEPEEQHMRMGKIALPD